MRREKNVRKNTVQNSRRSVANIDREVTELLRVKKKYNFKYIMTCKLIELHIIFALFIMCFILRKSIGTALLMLLLYILILSITLILYKKSAENTYISFQENKVVYRRKFLFVNKKEEMLYNEIKNISFTYDPSVYAKFWQKKFNIGNLVIYPKKGNIFVYGMELSCVGPLDKLIEDIKNSIGDKIK